MCLDCGCNQPDEDHGNPDHITYADLVRASNASGISVRKAARNIRATLKSMKTDKVALADVEPVDAPAN